MQNPLLLTLLLLLLTTQTNAQNTFSGQVVDDRNNPLIGVSLLVVDDESSSTVTDFDGCFTISHHKPELIVEVSYTGYRTTTYTLQADKKNKIQLKPATESLDEVVAIGYRRARRRDVTGSVTKVSSAEMRSLPAASASTPAPPIKAPEARPTNGPEPTPGQLTAGQINDYEDWDLWQDISTEDLAEFRNTWQVYPDHRYVAQLTFSDGTPVVDAVVELSTRSGEVVWQAHTDNQGRAELWRGFDDDQAYQQDRLKLTATYQRKTYDLPTAHPIDEGQNFLTINDYCYQPTAVDIAFVVDATGSMGDEMRYLGREMIDVMSRAGDSLADADLRIGAVVYRDKEDEFLTRREAFDSNPIPARNLLNLTKATGGGDIPEAVDAGLWVGLDELKWQPWATARLLFLVLDAPPHQDSASVAHLQMLTTRAAAKGVRLIPVVCSGMDKSGEYLLRSMALATNGTYVFLTDHSGIGDKHLEPTTDVYEVEKLNDLLVRLIQQYGRGATCGAQSPLVNSKLAPTEDAEDWTVFPNPTSGPVTLTLPKGRGEVSLLSAEAKLLGRYAVNRRRQGLDLSGLPAGAYYLRYAVGKRVSTRKVVIGIAR